MRAATELTVNGDEVQARKEADLIATLERLIEDARNGRLFGGFGVTFHCQGGKIGHYEERSVITKK